jgi:3-oxocholest-4-en-26-oate---CoA ligase
MVTWNLADLFEAVVDAVGGREALVWGGTDGVAGRLTFAELDERANRAANAWAAAGVAAGDRVGVGTRNGAEFVECFLGLLKLGAVPVNVNYRYRADELAYLFADAGLVGALVTPECAAELDGVRARLSELGEVWTLGPVWEDHLTAAEPHRPDTPGRSGDDLYLLYTGGTTGMPKGVMWRHEDIFFASLGGDGSPRYGIDRLERPEAIGAWAQCSSALARRMPLCPLMHGGAQWLTLQSLLNGGCAVLDASEHFDPTVALDLLAGEAVAMCFVIGDAVARPLVDALAEQPERWDLSALRVFASGGALLSPTVKERLGGLLAEVRIVDTFGASESGGQGRLVVGDGGGPPRLRCSDDVAVFDDDLRALAPGDARVGRLAKRGHIPYGYWGDPERTAAVFPTIGGQRWSLPGDLAQVAEDGTILVLGRGSVSINTGGEKVFPEEVEAVLRSHPAVADAVVVGVPDERFGQQVAAVVSLVPAFEDGWPGEQELARLCGERLAGYKVPRRWRVVDVVPRLATGKPDYAAAAALVA